LYIEYLIQGKSLFLQFVINFVTYDSMSQLLLPSNIH